MIQKKMKGNKMKMIVMLCVIGMVSLAVGCTYTDNYKAATARTAADIAMTVSAEEADLPQATVDQISSYAGTVETYLSGNEIATLTNAELKAAILEKIPDDYETYFSRLLGKLDDDDDTVIDSETLRVLINVAAGIKNGGAYFIAEDETGSNIETE